MPPIFEKPKTLNELSEYESQNLVCYLAGEWDGIGPNPGYSWREFHSDADLGEVPLWFNEWLSSFELENLVSIKYGKRHPMSLCLLKDKSRAEVAIFSYSSDEPAERVGESSYAMGSLSPDLLWPIVEDYLDRPEILQMVFQVYDRDLIPQEKVQAFLEKNSTAKSK
jgi:hypothetical protein